MNPSLQIWLDPPAMEPGAPMPTIRVEGSFLWVAYLCRNPEFPGWDSGISPDHPGFDLYCAVLKFEGVVQHHFGGPSDETLSSHPLYASGLRLYGFHEVKHTADLAGRKDKRHWIITFHDQTLEVIADQASIVALRVEGEDTTKAVQEAE